MSDEIPTISVTFDPPEEEGRVGTWSYDLPKDPQEGALSFSDEGGVPTVTVDPTKEQQSFEFHLDKPDDGFPWVFQAISFNKDGGGYLTTSSNSSSNTTEEPFGTFSIEIHDHSFLITLTNTNGTSDDITLGVILSVKDTSKQYADAHIQESYDPQIILRKGTG